MSVEPMAVLENRIKKLCDPAWIGRLLQMRFIRFGLVGASGVPVNLAILYLAQEHLFLFIASPPLRLNVSLATAILFATINNFVWNRCWTWSDRDSLRGGRLFVQFGQYSMACWFGMVLQVVFTKLLVAAGLHYLSANLAAIVFASFFNFVANDFWTFNSINLMETDEKGRIAFIPVNVLRIAWTLFAVLLAVFVYFYGLDGQHIPKNGDEQPYEHITRLTAESGRLLPLQSQMNRMRNTKPPLLFWQGIASTHWGRDWTLWNLRYPCVVYTLLTALLVFLAAGRISGRRDTGVFAFLCYLAFFGTFRFGRPFLTNAPETFWLFLPFFVLLYRGAAAYESSVLLPAAFGLALGVGLLYKSFVLLAPIAVSLAWWYLRNRDGHLRTFFFKDAWKIVLTSLLALGMFSLWFVFDPDPQAVLKEFVIGENMGKVSSRSGYLLSLFWGGQSVWGLVLGFIADAGLLAFPFVVLIASAVRHHSRLSEKEKLLWSFVLVLFVFFTVPSQRSGRYLLDAMPVMAMLLALKREDIHRSAFVLTAAFSGILLGVVGYLSIRLQLEMEAPLYSVVYWLFLCGALGFAAVTVFVSRLTRPAAPVVALLAMLAVGAFLGPFDGAPGSFGPEAQQYAAGKDVWVPCNFRAKDEVYRFLLPGAAVHGYSEQPGLNVEGMKSRFPLFIFKVPLSTSFNCPDCVVIGSRLELQSRHSNEQLKQMIFHGKILQHLFAREYLVEAPPGTDFNPPPDGCR